MAHNLVWRDFSEEQLNKIREPHPKRGQSSRDLLAAVLDLQTNGELNAISLDLYVNALQYADDHHLSDTKTSGWFSLVKAVHTRSTTEALTQERSFTFFKDELLRHSIQRPPRSIAVFALEEMEGMLEWMLDTYYRHYKLYQYAFNPRATVDASSRHPLDILELPPRLLPLSEAITEEQQQEIHAAEMAKIREAEAAAEVVRAAEAEAERVRLLREQYESAVPDEIQERVNAAVARELALLRVTLGAARLKDVPPGPGTPLPPSEGKP